MLVNHNVRRGVKLADMELVGITHHIGIGDRGLKDGKLEYKGRRDSDTPDIAIEDIVSFVESQIPNN